MDRIAKLTEMLFESPSDCFLMHALGLEYQKIGAWDMAKLQFEKVLETNMNYIGTYYHLAKTYERLNLIDNAITTYESGIKIANELKDNHARNELQMALEDLID
jgi:Tfp pilus assembly protein PilF